MVSNRQKPPSIRLLVLIAGFAGLVVRPTALNAVTFTTDTLIAAGDAAYDGQDVVVDGCIVTINGYHPFNSLTVANGGTLTHSANTSARQHWMDLVIATNLTLNSGCEIDVTGRGYTATYGPGAGSSDSDGSSGGGGHGGNGGDSSTAAGGPANDLTHAPYDLGSGGGAGIVNAIGGTGGGAVRLQVAGTLTLEGDIHADGTNGLRGYYNRGGGGGAGGSISLEADTIVGSGTLSADGGNSLGTAGSSAGGGGGRIALKCNTDGFAGTISAKGGTADYRNGGAGTVFRQIGSGTPVVRIDNGGNANAAFTPLGGPAAYEFVVGDGARFYPEPGADISGLTIESGGVVSSPAGIPRTEVIVHGNATIESGGQIDVSYLGFAAADGPGAGNYGWTGSGAGHGGFGGTGQDAVIVAGGSPYDSLFEPEEAGSGGGTGGTAPGGAGGGILRLIVDGTLTVDGEILASAADGSPGGYGTAGGGGSGGSIHVTANAFAGNGLIAANGGDGGNLSGGGGAGGRIAIYCDTDSFSGAMETLGGESTGNPCGGAGTIYVKTQDTAGSLIIAGTGADNTPYTPLADSGPYVLHVSDGARCLADDPLSIGGLDVGPGGILTQSVGSPGVHLDIQTDAVIQTGGLIDVSGCGHESAAGPGAGTGEWRGGGAGHGGIGGSSDVALGGGVYGSVNEPASPGSGGGWGYSPTQLPGGHGGGVVRLFCGGTLCVDGEIRAYGDDGVSGAYFTASGGGSGGSIWVSASTVTGTGAISASGGDGRVFDTNTGAGGGAGGRVALYSCGWQIGNLTVDVDGGTGHFSGNSGTVLYGSADIQITAQPTDVLAAVGDPVYLTIIAETTSGSLAYRWYKDGTPLQDDGHFTGTNAATLHIDAAQLTDDGHYDVVLTDSCGSLVSATARLTVRLFGDVDDDGDVDLDDYGVFPDCMAGPNATPAPSLPGMTATTCIQAFDFDIDDDVDLADFASFQEVLAE
ncbi:MAG: immunoglobulin domain-containing protein [Phycisphaerae bacterium]|nr:immunoglobulin domain-containing protein [Phycisphaerae bacterium]